MPKDKAYWQVYNQKRQAYLAAKKKESREKLKRLAISDLDLPTKLPSTWLNQPTIGLNNQSTEALRVVEQVVDYQQTVDPKKAVEQVVDIRTVVDQAFNQVVDTRTVVDKRMVVDNHSRVVDINHPATDALAVVDNSFQVVDNLSHLIHQYQTNTAYNCASTCSQNKYCSNCWYFVDDKLVNYKGLYD